jgi:FixJ family two-component response regulator
VIGDTDRLIGPSPRFPRYWTKVQYTGLASYARVPVKERLPKRLLMLTTVENRVAVKPLIAIVDDDESVCRAVRRLVRSVSMDAETFSSGQGFLDLLEAMPSFQPDCLILDVQMPGMNGLDVQERLARSGHTVPVIFITAHDEVGVREKALGAGAVAFLRKPFNDELLIKTLHEALKRN